MPPPLHCRGLPQKLTLTPMLAQSAMLVVAILAVNRPRQLTAAHFPTLECAIYPEPSTRRAWRRFSTPTAPRPSGPILPPPLAAAMLR